MQHPLGDFIQTGILVGASIVFASVGIRGLRGKAIRLGTDDIGYADPDPSMAVGRSARGFGALFSVLSVALLGAALRLWI
jgi:hypothetical protein